MRAASAACAEHAHSWQLQFSQYAAALAYFAMRARGSFMHRKEGAMASKCVCKGDESKCSSSNSRQIQVYIVVDAAKRSCSLHCSCKTHHLYTPENSAHQVPVHLLDPMTHVGAQEIKLIFKPLPPSKAASKAAYLSHGAVVAVIVVQRRSPLLKNLWGQIWKNTKKLGTLPPKKKKPKQQQQNWGRIWKNVKYLEPSPHH